MPSAPPLPAANTNSVFGALAIASATTWPKAAAEAAVHDLHALLPGIGECIRWAAALHPTSGFGLHIRSAATRTFQFTPGDAMPLLPTAPIVPATCVPWLVVVHRIVVVVGEVPAAEVVDFAVAVVVDAVRLLAAAGLARVDARCSPRGPDGRMRCRCRRRRPSHAAAGRQVPGLGRVDVRVRECRRCRSPSGRCCADPRCEREARVVRASRTACRCSSAPRTARSGCARTPLRGAHVTVLGQPQQVGARYQEAPRARRRPARR